MHMYRGRDAMHMDINLCVGVALALVMMLGSAD